MGPTTPLAQAFGQPTERKPSFPGARLAHARAMHVFAGLIGGAGLIVGPVLIGGRLSRYQRLTRTAGAAWCLALLVIILACVVLITDALAVAALGFAITTGALIIRKRRTPARGGPLLADASDPEMDRALGETIDALLEAKKRAPHDPEE